MKINPPKRMADKFGSGHYGDRRSKVVDGETIYYSHVGEDYACYPDSVIYPDKAGEVTKLGYCYSDDLSFRYVEVRDDSGIYARYFYVNPIVEVGDRVTNDEPIGRSQKLGGRYRNITEHVHLETFERVEGKKVYFDPNTYYLRA